MVAGMKHWPWRAVDQTGMVLDILGQSRRETQAAKPTLLQRHCRALRVMMTDMLASCGAAKHEAMPWVEHKKHKGMNQQGGELASAHRAARATAEALQVSRPGITLPLRPRRSQQPLPTPQSPSAHSPTSSRPYRSGLGSGRGPRRRRRSVTTSTPAVSRAVATLA